ncbi:hypothetical protein [Rubrolithibacter danxiaensis]|uniref:hypothetical protein n=1 Tax=Rubrolithibacter danxiaensis TaxID=3390805 RepID=UPI003BF8EE9F
MDVFDEELLLFWQILNKHQIKYIMIGGVATNLHGYQRTTEDIDIWLEDTLINRKKLRIAFKEYGLGDFESLERIEFIAGWTYFHLNNGIRLDIMTAVKGLEEYSFDNCLQLASIANIYDIKVPFLHINQLIQAKKAAARPKDEIDIIMLEKIREMQGNDKTN